MVLLDEIEELRTDSPAFEEYLPIAIEVVARSGGRPLTGPELGNVRVLANLDLLGSGNQSRLMVQIRQLDLDTWNFVGQAGYLRSRLGLRLRCWSMSHAQTETYRGKNIGAVSYSDGA